jgi:hypothetical protein
MDDVPSSGPEFFDIRYAAGRALGLRRSSKFVEGIS